MKQYQVTGMHCAACSSRVEKAVRAVPGVTDCSVNLLTGRMAVAGTASEADVIASVTAAGYGARVDGGGRESAVSLKVAKRSETRMTARRLIVSAGLLAALLYVSMGGGMWGWPLPPFLTGRTAAGVCQMMLSAAILVINRRFFTAGISGLLRSAPNMDTLVALGSGISFLWSGIILGRMAFGGQEGPLYFESAAMITVLITVGKLLESVSAGRTTDALDALVRLTPETARLLRDGTEVTVPVGELAVGDRFAVRAGDSFPVDGEVLEGSGAVNEAGLTGESLPVEKRPGDPVSAATVNMTGYLVCRATRVGGDTAMARIIKTVEEATATGAPIARTADRAAAVFVPTVMALSFVTLCVWLLLGQTVSYALERAVAVLVISCPCALGLATPVAIMVGSGVGARRGILFKTAAALELTGRVSVVALDKTGTVTEGHPRVTDLLPAEGVSRAELLSAAASLEAKSEHPLAAAVLSAAEEAGITAEEVTDFAVLPGRGLVGRTESEELIGGSLSLLSERIALPEDAVTRAEALSHDGKTPLLFAGGGRYLGAVGVSDMVKADAAEAVARLRRMHVRVILLTGDNERTARAVARQVGISPEDVVAGVLPEEKEAVIRRLRESGRVAMVGDGINDAPALTRADVGVAIGTGADIARDAADVVVMGSRLCDVPEAVALGRAVLGNIRENLVWAFLYNLLGIPLAAGCFAGIGLTLPPMFGAAAMSLSSFCVVMNALRLNLRAKKGLPGPASQRKPLSQLESPSHTEPASQPAPAAVTLTVPVSGMMCPHCEAHVTEALLSVSGVESASADHTAGTATVTYRPPATEADLRRAVAAAGYEPQ